MMKGTELEEVKLRGEGKVAILFNGAPNSGKDASASIMQGLFGVGRIKAFKDALYEKTAEHYGVDLDTFIKLATNRATKEKKSKLLSKNNNVSLFARVLTFIMSFFTANLFMTPREALIYVSEHIIKPNFGNDFFGIKLLEAILKSSSKYFFVPDSGFKSEVLPLLDAGVRVIVIRLHRNGCTFAGDSRSFLDDTFLEENGITFYDVDNNGTLEDLENKLLEIATKVI